MVDKDAENVSKKQQFSHGNEDIEGELLHDYRGRRYLVNSDYVEKQKQLNAPSEEHEIELNIAHQLMESNLKQLTDKQKTVVIGRLEGKTLKKIADEMGIHYTTVQEHLQSAQKKLAKLINQTKNVITEERNGSIDIDKTNTDSKEDNRERTK